MKSQSKKIAIAEFFATTDDIAEVNARSFNRSRLVRRWRIESYIIITLVVTALSYALLTLTTDAPLLSRIAGAVLFGSLFTPVAIWIGNSSYRTRVRKLIEEQYGKDLKLHFVVEVRPEGLIVKHQRRKSKHDWTQTMEIVNEQGDIVFRNSANPGWIAVVRGRAFSGDKNRDAFLALARHYAKVGPKRTKKNNRNPRSTRLR